jgi:Skp family chaperone for outer membrane proteins
MQACQPAGISLNSPLNKNNFFNEGVKMRKLILIIGICVSILLFNSSMNYASEKIGYFDMNAVITKSDAGKKATLKLKRAYEEKHSKIEPAIKDIIARERDSLKSSASSSKSELEMAKRDYQQKLGEYRKSKVSIDEELDQMHQELYNVMVFQIMEVIDNIKAKDKYTAILDINTQGVSGYSKDLDITNKVISEYNKYTRQLSK